MVQGFIRHNPEFRPARNRKPVILIGAGTGIGPLAGFARNNRTGRAMHLWFGARHPDSDLFYRQELQDWQATGGWPRSPPHFRAPRRGPGCRMHCAPMRQGSHA